MDCRGPVPQIAPADTEVLDVEHVTSKAIANAHPQYTMRPRTAYRAALAASTAAAVLLIWLSLGVGIIGADGDPANRMYFGVIALGGVGTVLARARPTGMARTLVAMAIGQAVIAIYATAAGLGMPYSPPAEILLLNAIFVAMFLAAAWLFRRARNEA